MFVCRGFLLGFFFFCLVVSSQNSFSVLLRSTPRPAPSLLQWHCVVHLWCGSILRLGRRAILASPGRLHHLLKWLFINFFMLLLLFLYIFFHLTALSLQCATINENLYQNLGDLLILALWLSSQKYLFMNCFLFFFWIIFYSNSQKWNYWVKRSK